MTNRKRGLLTAREVETLKVKGRYHAGDGLYLQVGPTGGKAWTLRFWHDGKARDMGLGRVRVGAGSKGLNLAGARMAAAKQHDLIRRGLDPIAERHAAKAARPVGVTFRELVDEYAAARASGWRNPKTATQFKSSLARHAFPIIGNLTADAITVAHVKRVVAPIWQTTPVIASRVREQIAVVLNAAIALGHRHEANPAEWRTFKHAGLPTPDRVRQPRHHAALAYRDVPAFMAGLRKRDTMAAKALQFTILTASRTSETIGARWDEIDMKSKTWVIGGERMKTGREHRVPLSSAAMRLLDTLPREADNPYLFIGQRRGRGLSNMSMLALLRKIAPGVTVHGFRSSFRTWAAERAKARFEIAEAALAHVAGSRTVVAYQRGEYLEERRKLMNAWAKYIS